MLESRVLTFRPDNSIDQRLSYKVFESQTRKFDFHPGARSRRSGSALKTVVLRKSVG